MLTSETRHCRVESVSEENGTSCVGNSLSVLCPRGRAWAWSRMAKMWLSFKVGKHGHASPRPRPCVALGHFPFLLADKGAGFLPLSSLGPTPCLEGLGRVWFFCLFRKPGMHWRWQEGGLGSSRALSGMGARTAVRNWLVYKWARCWGSMQGCIEQNWEWKALRSIKQWLLEKSSEGCHSQAVPWEGTTGIRTV